MFVAGILIYEFHMLPMASRLTGKGEGAVAGLLAAGYAGNWLLVKNNWMVDHLPTSISRVAVLCVGLSGTVLYCFAYRGVLQEVFSWTPLRWLGNMSYSYYLAHRLALHGLRLAAGRILPPDGGSTVVFAILLPAALLLTLAASAALFVAVEKPLSLAPSTRFRR
jgi:peptidoglycan/LPS O-acetylase OafA/YrhL